MRYGETRPSELVRAIVWMFEPNDMRVQSIIKIHDRVRELEDSRAREQEELLILRDRVRELGKQLETSRRMESEEGPDLFTKLRRANFERITHFKDKQGNPNHPKSGKGFDWFNALAGEVGELAGWRKKYERGDIDRETFVREAGKEVADIQTYLDIYACVDLDGAPLWDLIRDKFNEVSDRIGSSVKL